MFLHYNILSPQLCFSDCTQVYVHQVQWCIPRMQRTGSLLYVLSSLRQLLWATLTWIIFPWSTNLSLIHMSVRLSQKDPRGDLASFAPMRLMSKKKPPPQKLDKYHVNQSYGRRAGNSKDAQTKKNWNINGWHISFASFWAPSDMSTHEKAYLYAHTRGSFAMNAFHNVTSSQRQRYMQVTCLHLGTAKPEPPEDAFNLRGSESLCIKDCFWGRC